MGGALLGIIFPLSANFACLLGKKCYGTENAVQIEQFKAGLIGLAQVLLCYWQAGMVPVSKPNQKENQ
jgi:hypothetical protein